MSQTAIPLNALRRHVAPLTQSLADCAREVIGSGYYVLGPGVEAFEGAFAAYCGRRNCIGVGNGTDALELCIRALGIGPGDAVAVVANAAMYGTSAVLATGASPVFVDVDPVTSNMSVGSLRDVLDRETTVRAVIVTHLYGRLADIEAIVDLCRSRSVRVIEDCAQAHGARTAGGLAGSFGDIASFSFYPTKNLGAIGDGGAVLADDDALAARVRQLRQYGWSGKYHNELAGGRNTRLDELQARMLLLMLPLLDGWNATRRAIANRFSDSIRNQRISVPPVAGSDYVAHLYVVHCEARDALRDHLGALGVQTDVHYPIPDHRQPCHKGNYSSVSLPVTERLAETAVTLPCFPELADQEVQRVIDACNAF